MTVAQRERVELVFSGTMRSVTAVGMEHSDGTGKTARGIGQGKGCRIYLGRWLSRVSRPQSHRGPGPTSWDLVGLGGGPRNRTANKLPGDADAAGLRPPLTDPP